jgi:DNA segregation ATPase FtsK/SpoIIIE-like protein
MHSSKKPRFILMVLYYLERLLPAQLIMASISGLMTLFLAASLISYHPTDPSWRYYTTDGVVHNWCSIYGAHLAALAFYLFGMSAWSIIISTAYSSYYCWCRYQQRPMRLECLWLIGITPLLLACINSWYQLEWYSSGTPGGLFGNLIVQALLKVSDATIVSLLLHSCLIITFVLVLPQVTMYILMSMWRTLRFLVRWQTLQTITRLLYKLTHSMLSCALYSIRFCLRMVTGSQEILGTHQTVVRFEHHILPDDDEALDPFWQQVLYQQQTPNNHPVDAFGNTTPTPITVSDGAPISLPTQYHMPNDSLFTSRKKVRPESGVSNELKERAHTLEKKLEHFGVVGQVTAIKQGPVVTLFEYQPHIDTKISKILALEDDLAMALQALSIRIMAPIPGRSVVGFEVANTHRSEVFFADIVCNTTFQTFNGTIPLILGEDTIGNHVIADLANMPHVLVAGSTGSGKSVALNAMLISMLCSLSPTTLKLILIDPKRLEFAPYADIAHLLFPIVTDPKKVAPVLTWVVRQMEYRYELMEKSGVRNVADYNVIAAAEHQELLPNIVVVIDELADLMMTAAREVENLIARIAQMARAAAIHLIVATQRPSVDVITGLIKVNFTSRISFRVTSKVDSRTILDTGGADKLLGRGDMLFLDSHSAFLKRVHGAYVSDKEIESVISHIRMQAPANYLDITQELAKLQPSTEESQDQLYQEIYNFVQQIDEVSISLLQRKFRIGYNRSARIIDMLETQGLILPSENGKTRKVAR